MLHAESCRLIGPAGECRWRGYDLRRRSREACIRFRRERMQKCRAGRSAIRPAPLAQVVRDVRGAVIPASGHNIALENPAALAEAYLDFFAGG